VAYLPLVAIEAALTAAIASYLGRAHPAMLGGVHAPRLDGPAI